MRCKGIQMFVILIESISNQKGFDFKLELIELYSGVINIQKDIFCIVFNLGNGFNNLILSSISFRISGSGLVYILAFS